MTLQSQTFPVALERDVCAGSLVRATLEGLGIVLWRGDDDVIRVWEDRCPHRSVRLSAGRNLGDCVEGAYHGWRFGKDGTVIAIPAHGYEARKDITVTVLSSTTGAGFVWATLGDEAVVPAEYKPRKADVLIRPIPFRAPAATVAPALARVRGATLLVTPTGEANCFVFGHATPESRERPEDTARRCNDSLNAVRRSLETGLIT